jgi:Winged helix DNA-binding domain
MPGVTLATVSAAYDAHRIVRGSNIRGTVHTSTPEDNALLEVATRIGQRSLWERTLKLERTTLEDVWAGIEEFARDEWRTPAELSTHLGDWLRAHDPSAAPTLDNEAGRYFGFGHGGLLRRPLAGGWQAQGAPGYRAASAVISSRGKVLAYPEHAIDTLVRRHISSYGPASRHDLAWWAGVGLRVVDASLDRLAAELTEAAGPDGRTYHDLGDLPPARDLPGVRLLPEFDALFCGYDPKARERFVAPDHYRRLWLQGNGLLLAPLLVDGRLSGHWRIPGSGTKRPCEVVWFSGTRRPTKSDLAEPLAAVEAAYGITVTDLTVTRE